VGRPKREDAYGPTMRALWYIGGAAWMDGIQVRLTETERLTLAQFDQVYPTSGAQIVPDRMSWARSYLKIAGLVASGGRGIWVLTDEGRQAAQTMSDADLRQFVTEAGSAHNAKMAARKKAKQAEAAQEPLFSEPIEVTVHENASEAEQAEWNDALLQVLRTMDPAAFERLAQRLLRESGFVRVEVTGKSGDGGIDGSGVLRMNLISFQVLFQCKRYAGSVSAGTVRDFRGAMQGRADKGLIITTGTFTADARREATRDGAPAI